jgi:spermidine/putrescine transport system substrate-binding protein
LAEPLSQTDIPNLKHLYTPWDRAALPATVDSVPYFWGTIGIAYRQDLVKEPITSWKQVFEPDESLRNRLLVLNTAATTVGLALKSLGYSINSADPQALREVSLLLAKQRPYVRAYRNPMLGENSSLAKGDVHAAIAYNGDVLMLQELNKNIVYAQPSEGSALWLDDLVILKSSEHKTLAKAFINFINDPKINARNAQFVYYSTPNSAAEKLLPPEFLNNPAIYLSDEQRKRYETFQLRPPRIEKRISSLFIESTL